MRYLRNILVLGLLLLAGGVWGQSPADSLTSVHVERLREIAEWKSKWDLVRELTTYFLPIISILLGGALTYLGLKNRFQKWAEEEITKKATEKVGVDWGVVKKLVDERQALLQKRSAFKIAVVNQNTGEKGELSDLISGYGFPKPEFFTAEDTKDNSKNHFATAFKKGNFQLLLFDNEDGAMQEDSIIKMIEDNRAAFKSNILWYTKEQVDSYSAMTKNGVGFIRRCLKIFCVKKGGIGA